MSKFSEPISVRFKPEVREKISALAALEGIDQGSMIRRLVNRALVLGAMLPPDRL